MADQAATDSLIAQLLAQDRIFGLNPYYDDQPESGGQETDSSHGSREGKKQRRQAGAAARRKRSRAKAPGPPPSEANDSHIPPQPSGTEGLKEPQGEAGRRKRSDVGKQRAAGRPWNDQEECLFLQALELHGRNWKACSELVITRDTDAVKSHAQRHFIKLCLKGKLLPTKVAETGPGYTLSGNLLDPESSGAVQNGFKINILAELSTDELEIAKGGLLLSKLPASLGGSGGGDTVQGADVDKPPPPRPQRRAKTTPLDPAATAAAGAGGSGSSHGDQGSGTGSLLASGCDAGAVARTEYALARPKRHPARQQLALAATSESQLLVQPLEFIGQPGSGAPLAQPFQMVVHAQALAVADLQARLSSCEVIGLLGGTWQPGTQLLTVQEAYPCRCAAGSEATDAVELDPVAEVEVRAVMEARGQRCVGWYHSHPVFEPRPSQKDMENQRNYQALFRDPDARTEPFVGFIIGPYDLAMVSPASVITAFLVQQRNNALVPYALRFSLAGASELPSLDLSSKLTQLLGMFCGDSSRINPEQQWRPFTYLQDGHPSGPPVTKMEALQASLLQFMRDADPKKVREFLKVIELEIQKKWSTCISSIAMSCQKDA